MRSTYIVDVVYRFLEHKRVSFVENVWFLEHNTMPFEKSYSQLNFRTHYHVFLALEHKMIVLEHRNKVTPTKDVNNMWMHPTNHRIYS